MKNDSWNSIASCFEVAVCLISPTHSMQLPKEKPMSLDGNCQTSRIIYDSKSPQTAPILKKPDYIGLTENTFSSNPLATSTSKSFKKGSSFVRN